MLRFNNIFRVIQDTKEIINVYGIVFTYIFEESVICFYVANDQKCLLSPKILNIVNLIETAQLFNYLVIFHFIYVFVLFYNGPSQAPDADGAHFFIMRSKFIRASCSLIFLYELVGCVSCDAASYPPPVQLVIYCIY